MQYDKLNTNMSKDPESSNQANFASSVKNVKNMYEQKCRSVAETQKMPLVSSRKLHSVKKFYDLSQPSSCVKPSIVMELEPKTSPNQSEIKTCVIPESQKVDEKSSEPIAPTEPVAQLNASLETTDGKTDVSSSNLVLKPMGPKRGLPNSYKNSRNESECSDENNIDQKEESSHANQSLNSTSNFVSSLHQDESSTQSRMVSISKSDMDEIYSWIMKASIEMDEMKSKIKKLMESGPN